MQIIKVLVPKIGLFPLNYLSDQEHIVGQLVIVPFRNKELTGVVWEINCKNFDDNKKLKRIRETSLFPGLINSQLIELIKQTANYYISDLGRILKLVLPVDVNESPIKMKEQDINVNTNLYSLSKEQNAILCQIERSTKPVLLKGVTGSGKTEIYFHAVNKALKEGYQAIILLPEIVLSKQIISRFSARFGFEPIIWNSGVSKAQKKRILRGIISGSVRVVIGTRSALFLPYKELGTIVIDEEHDSSYKQEDGVLYNARDMAVLRSHIEKCKLLLISATPSIESTYNSMRNKYHLIELKSRFNIALLPTVKIIDMRQEQQANNSWLSKASINAIRKNIENNGQTLIFLNRRGYAPLMMCKSCNYRFNCKFCSSSMVMHKSRSRLECHHCEYTASLVTLCPQCGQEKSLILCGPGIERISEEVEKIFKKSKIALISKEQSGSSNDIHKLLQKIEEGEIDILIGTQIITKGYHFPNLTLVIVVDADIGFIGGDLRASERTFQLLHQVGGRAGRVDKHGTVLLQTYYPDHNVIKALVDKAEESFIKNEIRSRKMSNMPPFTKIATITITGKKQENTLLCAKKFVSIAPKSSARVLGPSEATMFKLSGKYRYKILIICNKNFNIQKYLTLWREYANLSAQYQLKIDIDPYNFI